MKAITTLLFAALLAAANAASAKSIEMDVNGLVCAFCAQGISKTMKAFPAADGVYVSLEHRLVAVRRTDESLEQVKARAAKRKGKPLPKDPHGHGEGEGMAGMGHDG